MDIVIVGAGKVGENLCKELYPDNNVILIDTNPIVIEEMFSDMDIQAIIGNGADLEVQEEARVEHADMFISVTQSDEINIIACIIAKNLGAAYTIARVRNPEYNKSVDFIKESLGINLMVNPDLETATSIADILEFPIAQNIEKFGDGHIFFISYLVKGDEPIVGMDLIEFDQMGSSRILICIMERNEEVFIPKGDTVILPDDIIYVTGSQTDLIDFFRNIQVYEKKINKALIIGGSRISYYLLKELEPRHMEIKLIERDRERAVKFAKEFPEIIAIHGDGTNQELLDDEGISGYEAIIALTGIDEENIMLSLFAKTRNIPKTVTKVNRTHMLKLVDHMGLDTIITPKDIISDRIIKVVKSLHATSNNAVTKLYKLADRRVEVLEFEVGEHCKMAMQKLKDLKLKDNTIIATIIRKDETIYPGGYDYIQQGDRVLIVTLQKNIYELDDLLKK